MYSPHNAMGQGGALGGEYGGVNIGMVNMEEVNTGG